MKLVKFEEVLDCDSVLNECSDLLENEKVVCIPTDTCYGLSCVFDSVCARDQIANFKRTAKDKPLTMIVSSVQMLYKFCEVSSLAAQLIEEYWPGPLTLLLPSKFSDGFIGVRLPDHSFLQSLVAKLDKPIFSTSANLTGQKEAYSIDELSQQFEGKLDGLDFILDNGVLDFNRPSTILKIVGEKLELIREGDLWGSISQRF